MTKGSVILNGVHFDDTAATITADDTSKTAAFLADGMTVKVKGTVSADGRNGVAEKVEVVNEARGAIASKGTDTVTVHGQTVLVDGGTVLAGGVTSIADLSRRTTTSRSMAGGMIPALSMRPALKSWLPAPW